MPSAPFSAMFSAVGLFYGVLVPLVLVQLFAFLYIASLLRGNGTVPGVGRAVYCYFAQSLGIVLMTVSALPALHGVLSGEQYIPHTYLALLFGFAFGGLSFLWHDMLVRDVDPASRAVPGTIHFYLWKLIGFSALLLGTLSLMLRVIFTQLVPTSTAGWAMHGVIILYGLVLTWCTSSERDDGTFHTTAVAARPAPVAAAKPVAAEKPKSKAGKRK